MMPVNTELENRHLGTGQRVTYASNLLSNVGICHRSRRIDMSVRPQMYL